MEVNYDYNLQVFTQRVNTLIESKLILTDKAIANLLKIITITKPMLDSVTQSLKEVSYATEFLRAKTTLTRPNGEIVSKLKLPQIETRLFAFVVCLLTEFDSGRRNLVEFLQEFYTNEDSNLSYVQFADAVLKPFKRAGEHILQGFNPTAVDDKDEIKAQNYFAAEKIYINSVVLEDMLEEIAKIKQKFEVEAFYSQQAKSDCEDMINALINALKSKNPKLIKIVWIGFVNTLKGYKSVDAFVRNIYSMLVDNNLL